MRDLVRQHDPHLVVWEAVEQGVPQDHAPAGTEADGFRVRRTRQLPHVLLLDADILQPLLGGELIGLRKQSLVPHRVDAGNEVRKEECEEERKTDEDRRSCQPPPIAQGCGKRHHDQDGEADEEKRAAEAEPVLEHPPAVAHVRDTVPPLPPELRKAERELDEPEEREPDHSEEHPGADPTCRGFPREARPEDGVEPQHDDEGHLREDKVDPDE
jgi:hypothetical protein